MLCRRNNIVKNGIGFLNFCRGNLYHKILISHLALQLGRKDAPQHIPIQHHLRKGVLQAQDHASADTKKKA